MRKLLCAALIAGTAAIAAVPAAHAAIGISLDFGNVSDAYSDGYWDSGHHWHAWRAGEWDAYRRAHPEHSHAWRHDDPHHH